MRIACALPARCEDCFNRLGGQDGSMSKLVPAAALLTAVWMISTSAETFGQANGFKAASVVISEAGAIIGAALLCGISQEDALSYEQAAVQVAHQVDPTTPVWRLQALYEAVVTDATRAFRQYGGPTNCGKILQAYADSKKQLGLR